jgi:hypothetical protein
MSFRVKIKDGKIVESPMHRVKVIATVLFWTWSLWAADRLPWFARKIAINALIGEEAYRDFMPLKLEHPNFDLCVKW